ncbi:hypothetical protein [Hydrogenophaga sp.]|nr:hypothetical protein [Hydrogenophaga sp.]MDM7950841.1 hypothetical protein [Hydrogenophaga sp.]
MTSKPITLTALIFIIAAAAYGVIEWLALSRSRAHDRLAGWRRTITRP